MKLDDTRQAYQDLSETASNVSRQLAFAALAVIWIFKTDQPSQKISVPHELFWPAILAIGALACDLLQYFYGAVAWGIYNRVKEVQLNLNNAVDFNAPREINWPSLSLFVIKIVLVAITYAALLLYLYRAITH